VSKREEDQHTIDRWRAAYAAANPGVDVPHIKPWAPGWYVFTSDPWKPKRYRISAIAVMASVLEERAK
jgi:hypothetical protein